MDTAFLPEESAPPRELSIKDYVGIIQRRRVAFILVFLLVLVAGILISAQMKPVYRTSATLLVPARSRSVTIVDPNNPISTLLAAAQPEKLDAQLRVLESTLLLNQAFRATGIVSQPNTIPPSVKATALEDTRANDTGDTYIVQVRVEGGDARDISRLANTVASLYLKRSELVTKRSLRSTLEFVRIEKDRASRSLANIERKLLQFREVHGGVELSTERESRSRDYGVFLERVVASESNIATTKAQIANLRAQLAKEPIEIVQTQSRENPRLVKLKDKLDELSFQRTDLLRDFRPGSRQIQDLDRQMAQIQRQLEAEPREIQDRLHVRNALRDNFQARLHELESDLRGHEENHHVAMAQLKVKKAVLDNLGPWEARINRLNRERDTAQSAYTALSDRLRDLEMRSRAHLPMARVIDTATVPTSPVRPRKPIQLALSLSLALLAACATVFLQEYLSDRVNAPEEAGKVVALPALAYVPLMASQRSRMVASLPRNSPEAEAYRALRASIGFASIDAPIRRLQIASPSPGEGRSTTAVNLATAMASDGKQVVLIDADLRSPSVQQLLNLPQSQGLSEVLAAMATVDQVLRTTEIENLRAVSAGALPPNPAELLGSRAFDQVLEQLEQEADVIIIDTPPCIPVSDAAIVAARMDGVVLVVNVGRTRKADLKHAVDLLGRTRTRIVGLVFNSMRPSQSGYYYNPPQYYRNGHDGEAARQALRPYRNGKESGPILDSARPRAISSTSASDEEA